MAMTTLSLFKIVFRMEAFAEEKTQFSNLVHL